MVNTMRCLAYWLGMISFCSAIAQSSAQPANPDSLFRLPATTDKKEASAHFVKFAIPSLLNGSLLDPSIVPNLAVDLGDEKVTFKTGKVLVRSRRTSDMLNATIAPYFGADDGVSKLFSKGKALVTYGGSLNLNYLFYSRFYTATELGVSKLGERVCRRQRRLNRTLLPEDAPIILPMPEVGSRVSIRTVWLSFRSDLEQKTFTLLDSTASFGNIKREHELALGRGYLSMNYFFDSALPRYWWGALIASVGIGWASFTNYGELDERELIEGQLLFNGTTNQYQTIAETTKGAEGNLKVYNDLTYYAELYKSLWRLRNDGAVRFGLRYTHFGTSGDSSTGTMDGGFFITTKKKPDEDGASEDAANFSISVRLTRFQDRLQEGYQDKNLSLLVGASVPLRFK